MTGTCAPYIRTRKTAALTGTANGPRQLYNPHEKKSRLRDPRPAQTSRFCRGYLHSSLIPAQGVVAARFRNSTERHSPETEDQTQGTGMMCRVSAQEHGRSAQGDLVEGGFSIGICFSTHWKWRIPGKDLLPAARSDAGGGP